MLLEQSINADVICGLGLLLGGGGEWNHQFVCSSASPLPSWCHSIGEVREFAEWHRDGQAHGPCNPCRKDCEVHLPADLFLVARFMVGQGFWVYGIQGVSKSGIRYIYAEIWVFSILFLLLTTNFGYNITYDQENQLMFSCYDGTDSDVFGTNRNSQQESASTEVQLLYSDLDCLRSAHRVTLLHLGFRPVIFWASKTEEGWADSTPPPHPFHYSEI